ncbi:LysR substrate-binding domain-containing protein [Pseudomonas fluorescens]|uniref:LysR substrate-binding domain-containing protein n=1 Tax=Pseudomonas fluorescens TaxID=294 RepID=UPI002225CD7D|nr:LysR substrate-binding domain-containing protein [Pseudomonas fluorescens]
MRTHHLLHEVLVPVCHPALLQESTGAATLDMLPRLHRRQNPDAWQRYSLETGIPLTNPAIGARYDLHGMLIEAALAGLGVALVPRLYVETELALGRLVAPWPGGGNHFQNLLPHPPRAHRIEQRTNTSVCSMDAGRSEESNDG